MKPTAQAVQQRVVQARSNLGDEAGKLLETAKSQVTGTPSEQAPGLGQSSPQISNPNQFNNSEALWAEERRKNDERIQQLRAMIGQMTQDENRARQVRVQQEEAWQQAQATALQTDKQKEEEKGGFVAALSKAAKRIKGRLGQVGKSKAEKGRAAGG